MEKSDDNANPSGHRWCFAHRRYEKLSALGKITCPVAWNLVHRDEVASRTEQDNYYPEPFLRQIRDGILELNQRFENEAPEIFIKPRQPQKKYVERDARLDEPKQSRRRRVNL